MSGEANQYSLAGNKTFCNYCAGYCCYRLEGSRLYIMAVDINRIARHLALSDGEVRHRFIEGRNTFKTREDGACIFLADDRMCKRCTIHEARPKQCREFPYENPCPYLEDDSLLRVLQARVEKSLAAVFPGPTDGTHQKV